MSGSLSRISSSTLRALRSADEKNKKRTSVNPIKDFYIKTNKISVYGDRFDADAVELGVPERA